MVEIPALTALSETDAILAAAKCAEASKLMPAGEEPGLTDVARPCWRFPISATAGPFSATPMAPPPPDQDGPAPASDARIRTRGIDARKCALAPCAACRSSCAGADSVEGGMASPAFGVLLPASDCPLGGL